MQLAEYSRAIIIYSEVGTTTCEPSFAAYLHVLTYTGEFARIDQSSTAVRQMIFRHTPMDIRQSAPEFDKIRLNLGGVRHLPELSWGLLANTGNM